MCAFCGTESPYQFDTTTGKVAEVDLVATLRDMPDDDRGWQTERRTVQCQSCKAVMVFDPARVGQNCEFCGSPALVAYEEIKAPLRPQGVLPFKIDKNRVREDIRRWWKSKWLAPGRLATAALVDTVRSLYIPYWTFDARVHCPWEAEAGYHYYVQVEGRDSKGNRVPGRNNARDGSLRQESSITSSMMSPCQGRKGCRWRCCGRWSRFRHKKSSLQHGVSLGTRRRALQSRVA